VAILIDTDAQFQNGFGAMAHSRVDCTFDPRTKRVTDIKVTPR